MILTIVMEKNEKIRISYRVSMIAGRDVHRILTKKPDTARPGCVVFHVIFSEK